MLIIISKNIVVTIISSSNSKKLLSQTASITGTADTLAIIEEVRRVPEPLETEKFVVVVPEVSPGPGVSLTAGSVDVLGVLSSLLQTGGQEPLPHLLHLLPALALLGHRVLAGQLGLDIAHTPGERYPVPSAPHWPRLEVDGPEAVVTARR